jgi:hypothetical protein
MWEWEPWRIEPREDLAAYDYVLTRGPGFDAPDGIFSRAWEGTHWTVWERRAR